MQLCQLHFAFTASILQVSHTIYTNINYCFSIQYFTHLRLNLDLVQGGEDVCLLFTLRVAIILELDEAEIIFYSASFKNFLFTKNLDN